MTGIGYRVLDALFRCFPRKLRFGLRMRFLPTYKTFEAHAYAFAADSDELRLGWKDVIFAEGRYHEAIDHFLAENSERIETIFSRHRLRFIYGPHFQKKLAQSKQFAYFAPYADAASLHYGSEWVIRDLLTTGKKEDVPPMLLSDAFYDSIGKCRFRLGYSLAHFMDLEETERFMLLESLAEEIAGLDEHKKQKLEEEIMSLLSALPEARLLHPCRVWSYDYMWEWMRSEVKCSRRRGVPHEGTVIELRKPVSETADESFDRAMQDMLANIRGHITELQVKYGLSRAAIIGLLGLDQPEEPLSRLRIDADYCIWLPDYHNMEVKITPLVKAVYLLFLSHEEGIVFKHLKDYGKELLHIYANVLGKDWVDLSEDEIKSVKRIVDPLDNSINEKCARIREAFLKLFDEHLARYYVVDGERGKEKKIALPRQLVIWD